MLYLSKMLLSSMRAAAFFGAAQRTQSLKTMEPRNAQ